MSKENPVNQVQSEYSYDSPWPRPKAYIYEDDRAVAHMTAPDQAAVRQALAVEEIIKESHWMAAATKRDATRMNPDEPWNDPARMHDWFMKSLGVGRK